MFKPTYLYVKRCQHCGLLYFGKTVRDPMRYRGSGTLWKNHLERFSAEHDTKVLGHYTSETACRKAALSFSEKHQIHKSPLWANLIPEAGGPVGGNTRGQWTKKRQAQFQETIRQIWAERSFEERRSIVEKGLTHTTRWGPKPNSRSPEKSARISKAVSENWSKLTKKQRSERAKHAIAGLTPEQLIARARKGVEARDPERERMARIRAQETRSAWSESKRRRVQKNMSAGRKGKCTGGGNGRAIPVEVKGVFYETKRMCQQALGISEFVLNRMLKGT